MASDKRSENAVYAGDKSRQEVHNAIFLRGKIVYKTCPTLGINSNSERCFNEIDTRVPNSMGSVYEATSHVEGVCSRNITRCLQTRREL